MSNVSNGGRWQLVSEFVEVESGTRAKRPQLEAALATCKKQKAKLVVAKLDRLSRKHPLLADTDRSRRRCTVLRLPDVSGAMDKLS